MNRKVNVQLTRRVGIQVEDRKHTEEKVRVIPVLLHYYRLLLLTNCLSQAQAGVKTHEEQY